MKITFLKQSIALLLVVNIAFSGGVFAAAQDITGSVQSAAQAQTDIGSVDPGGGFTFDQIATATGATYSSSYPAASPEDFVFGSLNTDTSGLCSGYSLSGPTTVTITVSTAGDDADTGIAEEGHDGLGAFTTIDGLTVAVPTITNPGSAEGDLQSNNAQAPEILGRGYNTDITATDTRNDTGIIKYSVTVSDASQLEQLKVGLVAESLAGGTDGISTNSITGVTVEIDDAAIICPAVASVAGDSTHPEAASAATLAATGGDVSTFVLIAFASIGIGSIALIKRQRA